MDGSQLFYRLELDDQFATNQKVGATFADAESLVLHGQWNLTLEGDLTTVQLNGKRM